MDDFTTERSFNSQAKWVTDVPCIFVLTFCPWVFVQPAIGGRPVDWWRN